MEVVSLEITSFFIYLQGSNQIIVVLKEEPIKILQKYWGYEAFRPLQEPIIQSVLDGKDTLALLPTGGGKSICFQVPTLCQEGICLVISPLIALMKDQVQQLQKRQIPAAAIHTGMSFRQIDQILDNCIYGNIKFLYLSPERLKTEIAIERIKKMNVSLLAIDEAHCISQWGYDFRPSYLEIAQIRALLPKVPLIALTATATGAVVEDIQEKLLFDNGQVFQQSFARPNLAYVVLQEEGKRNKLLDILRKVPGSGIVYVRSRRKTKALAYFLQQHKIAADFYHAGLSPEERSQKQEGWIDNKIRIMVCTNAFGMGIDKSNVRTVVHMEPPDSLEAYFQEAGRVGRDGQKAYATLLYNSSDRQKLERLHKLAFPDLATIRQTYRALGSYFQIATGGGVDQSLDFDITDFCSTFQLEPALTFQCLRVLEKEGWLFLSEAVYIPSSLKINVSKDALYDYQLKHPKMDPILKIILRTYQGAFQHFINIKEKQLAKFLKISPTALTKGLELMHAEGIIQYRPQKDKPQLVFLQERVAAENLTINQELYRSRKDNSAFRLKKVLQYAERPFCRQQQLLHYFGETTSAPCGICDVCLGRTKTNLDTDAFERMKNKIYRLLKRERLSLDELLEAFPSKRQGQLLQTLEYLESEGIVVREENKLIWK